MDWEADSFRLLTISRKSKIDEIDIDFLLGLLQKNLKCHQHYIEGFVQHREMVEFEPRYLIKAINLQYATIDWLYNTHCLVADAMKAEKKRQEEEEKRIESEKKVVE